MKKFVLLLLTLGTAAFAQEETAPSEPAAPAQPAPCTAPEYRQFDFWLGHWTVTANGQPAGTNRIESVLGGCALSEHWTSAAGNFAGTSLNLYDQARGVWHQSWADTSGTLLQLDGGLEDGRMVLRGARPGPQGNEISHRITWTPNEDGSVRQLWETRSAGQEWSAAFDGLYVKTGNPE